MGNVLKELNRLVNKIFTHDRCIYEILELDFEECKNDEDLIKLFDNTEKEMITVELGAFVKNFLNEQVKNGNILQYSIEEEEFFDSPGYDTGAVFVAFVTKENKLKTVIYQWERC